MTQVPNEEPRVHPEVSLANEGQYIAGFVISLVLLGISLLLVLHHAFSPNGLLLTVAAFAAAMVLAQLRLLFHLDFSETQIWNTLTLALNVPLLILSIGLTAWMFRTLYLQVMMPGMAAMH